MVIKATGRPPKALVEAFTSWFLVNGIMIPAADPGVEESCLERVAVVELVGVEGFTKILEDLTSSSKMTFLACSKFLGEGLLWNPT